MSQQPWELGEEVARVCPLTYGYAETNYHYFASLRVMLSLEDDFGARRWRSDRIALGKVQKFGFRNGSLQLGICLQRLPLRHPSLRSIVDNLARIWDAIRFAAALRLLLKAAAQAAGLLLSLKQSCGLYGSWSDR